MACIDSASISVLNLSGVAAAAPQIKRELAQRTLCSIMRLWRAASVGVCMSTVRKEEGRGVALKLSRLRVHRKVEHSTSRKHFIHH